MRKPFTLLAYVTLVRNVEVYNYVSEPNLLTLLTKLVNAPTAASAMRLRKKLWLKTSKIF